VTTMSMAGFAKHDKNYSEMRALLMTALLFLSLWLDKVLG
jgi:hypothetical protein